MTLLPAVQTNRRALACLCALALATACSRAGEGDSQVKTIRAAAPFESLVLSGPEILATVDDAAFPDEVVDMDVFDEFDLSSDFSSLRETHGSPARVVDDPSVGRFLEYLTPHGRIQIGYWRDASSVGAVYRWRTVTETDLAPSDVLHPELVKHLDLEAGTTTTVHLSSVKSQDGISVVITSGRVKRVEWGRVGRQITEFAELPSP